MISPARTTLLMVSAILLALQCVDGAPSSEVSEKSHRTARYVQFAAPKENSAAPTTEAKQYNNNGGDHNNGGNNNASNETTNGNFNTGNNNIPVNNGINGGNIPPNEPSINDNLINNENPISDLSVPPEQPPQHVGFAAVVSSFWDMVLSFIRGSMGLKRREPPRIARAFIGAAVGNDECMRASACHAGRMMRALDNNAVYFTVAELLVTDDWKPVVRRIRRATEDKEDCNIYQCNV